MSGDASKETLLVIIGAGGHAGVVIDAVRARGHMRIHGLLDENQKWWKSRRHGCEVLGGDEMLSAVFAEGIRWAFLGIGMVRPSSLRHTCAARAAKMGFQFPTLVHPSAWVSPSATLGEGTFVGPMAVVNSNVVLGSHVIVNSGAIVEHDCRVGNFSHVATGACLAGNVRVGLETLIGARAVVREGLTIGDRALIGAGAVVVKAVPDRRQAVGVPARLSPYNQE